MFAHFKDKHFSQTADQHEKMTNALAYFDSAFVTKKKKVLTSELNGQKLDKTSTHSEHFLQPIQVSML